MCGASAVYFRVTENLRPIRIMRLAFVTSALALLATSAAAQAPSFESRVDSVFRRWNTNTPGCGVGVAQNGKVLLTKGYGMANLEYGVPLGANSVLESGSVAKQFTSAALALLQLEGKLSLDDDIRKYLPEVPDFGATITIRHLLTHTSGLRDQWGLLTLTGNPPTSQVHTLPLILHIVSRQRELNFPPGAEFAARAPAGGAFAEQIFGVEFPRAGGAPESRGDVFDGQLATFGQSARREGREGKLERVRHHAAQRANA